ncbi:MAG: HAMP domain-containing histidine kinase [Acidobacteria bacterium]|nr:HAMP domain-containing histidine kinase [Acidobacteriota bacterium]
MNMEQIKRQALFSWAAVAVLALLCGALAILQYKWVGQVTRAQQERHRKELQIALTNLGEAFNTSFAEAVKALRPADSQVESMGREEAYAARFRQWRASGQRLLFRAVALAVPQEEEVNLLLLDFAQGRFQPANWPESWSTMRQHLLARTNRGGRPPPNDLDDTLLFEIPRFGRPPHPPGTPDGPEARPGEQEWLILELDGDYVRKSVLPRLIQEHLPDPGTFRVEVTQRGNPSAVFFHYPADDADRAKLEADATITLFEPNLARGLGMRRGGKGPPPQEPVMSGPGRGRWQMTVMHASGSEESAVRRARWQNLAISAAIFLLMFAVVAALMRFSRQAQQLAELQMNFVANVSHELRTPLTVIRTAAHNLKGRVAANPAQVERYGDLIQREGERLSILVEQVLRFAGGRVGNVIREKTPVAVENVIEDSIRASKLSIENARLNVDKTLAPGLPLVMADELALQHAIQNLLDNAVKYGTEGNNWIGIEASPITGQNAHFVEIRISDRGPGIPHDEQDKIFDPFFRGRRAVMDQIHGTGLGLNLVKKIIEAHGGTVRVHSEPMKGTEFVIRIPAAPPELQDEFAHSID